MNRLAPAVSCAVFCAALSASPALAETPGYRDLPVPAGHRPQPMQGAVYFPADAGPVTRIGDNILFHGRDIRRGAEVAGQDLPLVIVSHGSGGNAAGLAWLGAGLARAGMVVAMVNHPGSTSGDSIPLESIHLDRRVRDLSALIDAVLADPELGGHIDPARISALGFSMGGGTVLMAAGARFERDRYAAHCHGTAPAPADCAWLESGGVDLDNLPEGVEQDLRDPRIGRVVAVDPAYSAAFTPQSLGQMALPVQLVNLGDTGPGSGWEAVGVGPEDTNLAAPLPEARFHRIENAWHFSFLAECRLLGPLMVWWEGEDPICSNPWFSDRGEVHAQVIDLAAGFVLSDPEAE